MRTVHDLGGREWKLSPFVPYFWQFQPFEELAACPEAQIVTATVPGSVQKSLLDAGLLPDWNIGQAARACEWVENRHWVYELTLPDDWFLRGDPPLLHHLVCECLDYAGWVYLNGKLVGEFRGTHIPWRFDLTPFLTERRNILRIIFDLPPRWLGQFGYTSRMRDWKPRFNYTWDWSPRLVQVGIAGAIRVEATDGRQIESPRCVADAEISDNGPSGVLRVSGRIPSGEGTVRVTLRDGKGIVRTEELPSSRFSATGVTWSGLPVDLWQPNGCGRQPLYDLDIRLVGAHGQVHDTVERRVGFRSITWRRCEGAPAESDPWLCAVNGIPTFLQGVNYPPVLPNWADVTREDHRKRLALYRDLGMNILRINACQFLESSDFYDLCDQYGLMVWQEMPLTSSGVENTPPEDAASIREACRIARSFVERRQHHASLILWSGGNELLDPGMKPYTTTHPMLGALERVFNEEDASRRYIPTSPSGPRWGIEEPFLGKGLHWDVHGPWKPKADLEEWKEFWRTADALFYSELGSPSASPADLIVKYAGALPLLPVRASNPLYCLTLSWWTEDQRFETERGHRPSTLNEYVAWSQERQATALAIAVRACKDRFPRCGGVILWCGHDCFPMTVNTSIIDFEARPKPAAITLAPIYKEPVQ